MNKTIKGALGASAAAVLLLGGAGTLAYWSDDASVNGGQVNSGYLTIDPVNTAPNTTPCDTVWKHTNGGKSGQTVVNVVPGDIITKSCTFKVTAQGDNLTATPTVPATIGYTVAPKTGGAAPTTLDLPVTATYTLGTSPFTSALKVTEADDTKTLTAKIQVAFPYGTATTKNANDTQNLLVTLNDLQVKLVQDNNGV